MCLIALALNAHPRYPFLLIANRDEFYERPTSPAHSWPGENMIAGKDLKAGGTWMGVSRDGRFAAVTNFRDIRNIREDVRSRGELPINYLRGQKSAQEYLEILNESSMDYNGFNLLLYENGEVFHYSNYEKIINNFDNGIFGLSNALLDTPWPKVMKIKSDFSQLLGNGSIDIEDYLSILIDEKQAEDPDLPETGLSLELERALSSVCIRTENYGTCSSSVLSIDTKREVFFVERTYSVGIRHAGDVIHKFVVEK